MGKPKTHLYFWHHLSFKETMINNGCHNSRGHKETTTRSTWSSGYIVPLSNNVFNIISGLV